MKMRYSLLLFSLFVCTILSAQQVRIMTYNIHHANPPSIKGKIDLEAIAKVINDAQVDIVGVQEVDVRVGRSGQVDQAKKLAQLTNMEYFFSKGIDLDKGEYGVLILSKHKIVKTDRYDLPMVVKSENRSLAVVDIKLANGQIITFANTHLDLKEENKIAQVRYIDDLLKGYKNPVILVGDLNSKPDSQPIQLLEENFVRNSKDGHPTFPQINPNQEIDYIVVSKATRFKWKKYEVLKEEYPSDHLPLVADIKLK